MEFDDRVISNEAFGDDFETEPSLRPKHVGE